MKKTLSVLLSFAMLISLFSITASVQAEVSVPEVTVESSVYVTIPAAGDYDHYVTLARFTPQTSGYYEITCLTPYTNTKTPISQEDDDTIPGGVIAIDEDAEGEATQGLTFFLDSTSLTPEMIEALSELGMQPENINTLKFTANLKAGQSYCIKAYQDGAQDYSTTLTVAPHTHTITGTKEEKVKVKKDGTSDELGGIYETCEDWFCAYMEYTTVYMPIESTTVKNAVYTGKAVTPAVTIKTSDGKKLSTKYYTVSYKNNKKVGKGSVTIKFRNGYTGTVTKSFKINPRATAIKKVTAGKNKLKVSYKKKSITAYQVQVATNSKFTKNKKTVTVKGSKKTKATIKNLKGGKKYYVRVRTYKVVGGTKYYSAWSSVKTKTTKK